MKFVSRSESGLRLARHRSGFPGAIVGTTIHYEGPRMGTFSHSSCATKVRAIQAFHMDERGWSDAAYTCIVCPHGYVYELRWIGVRTGANGTNPGNRAWYAVCALIGQGDPMPRVMVEAIAEVCDFLRRSGRAGSRVNGHRDHKPTACPGDPLYREVQRGTFLRGSTPAPPPPTKPPPLTPEQIEEKELMAAKDDIIEALEESKPMAVRVSKRAKHTSGRVIEVGEVWILSAQGMYHVQRASLDGLRLLKIIRNQNPVDLDGVHLTTIPIITGATP